MNTNFGTALWATLLASLIATDTYAAQAMPSSMSVSPGTYNGRVTSLAAANEGKVVNFYTNGKGNLGVILKYSTGGLLSGLQFSALIRQHTGSDSFSFQVLNSAGKWINIQSTTGGTAYKTVKQDLPNGSVVNGLITLRIIASDGSNDLDLDQLVILDQGVVTSPTPISTPVSTPTPTSTPISSPTPTLPPTAPGTIPAGTSWYWQLQGTINQNVAATIYDIDLYDTSAATISSLKQSGHLVVCYFSAGTYENWRVDANQFPAAAIGQTVDGWVGENWLDVRNQTVRNIMASRMDLAKSKGCNSLEPDNVDGYSNRSGFPLTAQDQINFNSFLADQAHARGMTIALKNSTDLVASLVNKFDFAVVEECFKYNECGAYSPFVQQNKAVLNAEYTNFSSAICSQAKSLKFSTVFYNLNLNGAVYNPCP